MISFPHLHVPQRQTCYMQTCRTIFLSADFFCSVSKYFAISVWARTGGLARLGLLCLAGRSSGRGSVNFANMAWPHHRVGGTNFGIKATNITSNKLS